MLKKSDLARVSSYERWDGFVNLNYFSGWADNICEIDGRFEFDLRQTAYDNQKLSVRLDNGEYLPSYFKDHKFPPVKIIARVQQDPKIDYSSLIIRPLYIAKPSLIEMPSPQKFFVIGSHGAEHKTFNPFLDYESFKNLSFLEQQKASNRCSNKSYIAGVVKAKKKVRNDTLLIELLCAENRVIPARLYGKLANQYYNELLELQPVLIEGALNSREDKDVKRIETFIKVSNLTTVIAPGKHIPKNVPAWYLKLQEIIENNNFEAINNAVVQADDTAPLYDSNEVIAHNSDNNQVFHELKFDPQTGEPILNNS